MKQKLFIISILYIFLFGCFHLGQYSKETNSVFETKTTTKDLVDKIFFHYTNYTRLNFSSLISDKFLLGKLQFLNKIEEELTKRYIVEIDYTINQIFLLNEKLVINFKWQSKKVLKEKLTVMQIYSEICSLIIIYTKLKYI